jgi:hypothetical protein
MKINGQDRMILRDLAKEVAEIASRPNMVQRRQRWVEHNSLRSTEPMMLIFPEGAWEELLPTATLRCGHAQAREIEWNLRSRIYTFNHFQDDTVIEAEWIENAVVQDTGWGLDDIREESSAARGAYRIEPALRQFSDLNKMHFPELVYDEPATQARLTMLSDLFGDILTIRPKGVSRVAYGLTSQYLFLRGETALLMDMVDDPGFIHEVMAFLVEGHRCFLKQLIEANLLSLNNDSTYHSSGGNGYTDELPRPGFDPQRVRPCDMWASAESQEMQPVSPKMHREFVQRYEKQLLEPFGLTGYGCCEDLSRKLEDVFIIPNIRRISCSPFANVDVCAEKLKGNYIFSWKPQPAHLVGDFDQAHIRGYIKHTLEVTRANYCFLEMILKDTHTVEHHPERMDDWTRIARQLINDIQ